MTNREVKTIRMYQAGFIGGEKVAKKATKKEVEYLVKLGNQYAKEYNQAMETKQQFWNLANSIELREKGTPEA